MSVFVIVKLYFLFKLTVYIHFAFIYLFTVLYVCLKADTGFHKEKAFLNLVHWFLDRANKRHSETDLIARGRSAPSCGLKSSLNQFHCHVVFAG